jgi:HK97 family phage major capsid protein
MATKDVTLNDVANFVFEQMFNDPKLREVPENERAAYVAKRFNALAEEVAEARAEAKVTGIRTQMTELQSAMTEMQERATRAEKFRANDHGFHRGIDGKLQPNVSRETAETLVTMIRAMKDKEFEKARAVSSGVGAEGGFLLQTDVAADILRLVPDTGLYPQIARPWPMGTKKVDIGSVLSQMGAYWPEENNAITPSFPGFGKVSLEAKLLGALIPVPLTLIEDSTPELGQLFADLIRECIALEIDRVAIVGKSAANGGTDPFDGLLNSTGIKVKVMDNGHTSFKNIGWEYLQDLQDTVPEGARDDNSYLINQSVFNFLRKQKDADGQPIWQRPADGEPGTLCGKPYFKTERMPAYSAAAQPSKRSALYGNWKKWAIFGNRKELTIATSDVAGDAFKNVQLILRGITRVGFASFGPAISTLETAAN